ncbi:GntR family transcriptional regulator [Kitasatospora sp. NBC_01287]|uniref:GntR family transcriptional regulator n=1 Tax=Kitasatospora sp. NBC_01287 TaxID=2903573 RepID=UPI0022538292|nr:GntR family transcriptional regulator [Kitasatospora sp. NBC_01287]MCX4751013.1 GntR family transcriptional regulator [Kitasatospora sp. NBC_01287]
MILSIDPSSAVAIYQQVRDQVVAAIAVGELVEGSALPSTRQLAGDLGINFHTVNKAYDLLRQEGLLRLNRKSGAVVRRDPLSGPPPPGFADEWSSQLRMLLAEAAAQGMDAAAVPAMCGRVVGSFGARLGGRAGELRDGELDVEQRGRGEPA